MPSARPTRWRRCPRLRPWPDAPALLLAVATALALLAHAATATPAARAPAAAFDLALRDTVRDARSPAAFAPLLALRADREQVSAARYAEAFDRLAALAHVDPGVAAEVARERARLLRGRGEDDAAAAIEDALGVARRWFVAGPFPTDRGAGLGARHAVEDALVPRDGAPLLPPLLDVAAGEPGLGFRPVSPRADGLLNLEASLWPRGEVFAYAGTYVHAERPGPAALRLGASAAVRVWLNGVPVHERSGATTPVADADEVGVHLREGWNLIVVKLYRGDTQWGVVLRATAPDGAPLPGLRALGPDETPPAVAAAAGPAPYVAVAPGPYAWWSARADELPRARWTPSFVTALARVLQASGRTLPLDRQPAALLASLGTAPPPDALLALTQAEPAPHRRASTLSRLLRSDPTHEGALLALADLERERQRYVRALDLLERLPGDARRGWRARFLRARTFLDNQVYGEARVALRALVEERPDTPVLLRTLANLEVERGARRAALALFERLAATAQDDPEVLFWLSQLHRDLRDPETALRWQERFAHLRPDLPQSLLEQARTLDAWGRTERAAATFDTAVERFPRDPEVLGAAASFHHRHGETGRALALWQRRLELEPHDPDLRAYLEYLAPSEPSFEAPFRRDAAAVAAPWRGPDGAFPACFERKATGGDAAAPPSCDDDDVAVLLDQRVVRVYPNGATSRFQADVLAVRRPPREEENRRYRILFDPLRQRVEVLEAAVVDPAGGRREQLGRRELRLSEAWYGLYYELHAVELSFGGLEPGDVLSIAYRVVDLEPGPRAGTFGDLAFIQGPAARREVEYVVVTPSAMPLQHRLVAPSGDLRASRSETSENGTRTVRYVVFDVPAVPQEPDAPGEAERAAYVHVSTFRDFAAVGRWYEGLARGARRASAAVRDAARAAAGTAGAAAPRIAALHRAVVERIRYVGLEFGIHGIQPYDAPEVYERRFGDCKDTATLLTVMLDEVGLAGEVVLVRTRRLGRVPEWPASLAVFDHAVVYVPGADLWLDPTVRDAPPGVLPPGDQGALALRLTADGPRLVTIPRSPAAADRATLVHAIRLDEEGVGALEAEETWTGWRGAELRGALRTPLQRPRAVQERLAARRPGAAVDDVRVDGLEGLAPALRLRYRAKVPALADPDRLGLRLPAVPLVPPLGPRVSRAIEDVHEGHGRRLPLDVPNRFADDVTVRVTLPSSDWSVATAPVDRHVEGPYGTFSRTFTTRPDGFEVHVAYAVTATSVPAAEVAALADFCDSVDRALADSVIVTPGAATPEGDAALAPLGDRGRAPREAAVREGGGS